MASRTFIEHAAWGAILTLNGLRQRTLDPARDLGQVITKFPPRHLPSPPLPYLLRPFAIMVF
jgi:hypothetical protein